MKNIKVNLVKILKKPTGIFVRLLSTSSADNTHTTDSSIAPSMTMTSSPEASSTDATSTVASVVIISFSVTVSFGTVSAASSSSVVS
jgi:hypothetical protein